MTPSMFFRVTQDGRLGLEAEAAAARTLDVWLPAWARAPVDGLPEDGARIRIGTTPPSQRVDREPNALVRMCTLGGVRAEHGTDENTVILTGCAPHGVAGELELGTLTGTLTIPVDAAGTPSDAAANDLYTMLTMASALVLGRLHRALAHAAAVIDPEGRTWLLVGDTHAGKTSTCATLLDGGWRYTSDDHVVLLRAPDGTLVVEGWPRRFHLDRGWGVGASTGVRDTVDPQKQWPNQWVASAPLGGVLFPTVVAHEPTIMTPITAGEAFARIVRQSPWLMADRSVAPFVMTLLSDVARYPAFALRLGADCYAETSRLRSIIARAMSPMPTTASTTPARTAS